MLNRVAPRARRLAGRFSLGPPSRTGTPVVSAAHRAPDATERHPRAVPGYPASAAGWLGRCPGTGSGRPRRYCTTVCGVCMTGIGVEASPEAIFAAISTVDSSAL